MKKQLIFAIAGNFGSGKDTVTKFLTSKYGFHRIAFADNLKQMAMAVFGLTYAQCYDEDLKMQYFTKKVFFFFKIKNPIKLCHEHIRRIIWWAEKKNGYRLTDEQVGKLYRLVDFGDPKTGLFISFDSPRHLLQYLGTEILRECIDNYYHTTVVKREIDKNHWEKVAISDSRFGNEREVVKQWDGFNILVTGRNNNAKADEKAKSHASENSLGTTQEYDYLIINSGTLEELEQKVVTIVSKHVPSEELTGKMHADGYASYEEPWDNDIDKRPGYL